MTTNIKDKSNSKMVSFRMPIHYLNLLQELSDKLGLPKSEILRQGLDSINNSIDRTDQGL